MALTPELRARVISAGADRKVADFKRRGHVWLACVVGLAVFWYVAWQVVT